MANSMEGPANSVDRALAGAAEILAKAESRAIAELKPFAEREPDKDELFACFEIFQMQDYGLGYNKNFVVERDGQKKLKTVWDEAGPAKSFIPGLKEYFAKFWGEVEFNEEEGEKFMTEHEKQLLDWFSKCWKAAGGEHSKVPTYFSLEKEYQCRDLFTGEIMKDLDVAKKLDPSVVDVAYE